MPSNVHSPYYIRQRGAEHFVYKRVDGRTDERVTSGLSGYDALKRLRELQNMKR